MRKKGKNKPSHHLSRPPEKFNTEKRKTAEKGLYKMEKSTVEVRKLNISSLITQFHEVKAKFLEAVNRKTLNLSNLV